LSGVLAVIKAGQAPTRDQVIVDIRNTPSVIALAGRIEGVVHREPGVSQAFDQISEELQNHQRPEENQSRLLSSPPQPRLTQAHFCRLASFASRSMTVEPHRQHVGLRDIMIDAEAPVIALRPTFPPGPI
jgi:hypothetical protein